MTSPATELPAGYAHLDLECVGNEPDAASAAWQLAESFGFHGSRPEATELGVAWRHLVTDGSRIRGVIASDRPAPLENDWPVATYRSFDGTVNTGAALADSNFVSDVTVRGTHRRRGLLRAMITRDLVEARERGLPFASLTASEGGLYGRFGFGVSTRALAVKIARPRDVAWVAPSAGSVDLLTIADAAPVRRELFARWHSRFRGSHSRKSSYAAYLDALSPTGEDTGRERYAAAHVGADGVDGLVTYRLSWNGEDTELTVIELLALDSAAERGLWRYVCGQDLLNTVLARGVAVDSPVRWAATDVRAVAEEGERDAMWLRVLDVPQALRLRGWEHDGAVTLRVVDPMGLAAGTWRVEVVEGRAEVSATEAEPDATLDAGALATAYTGAARVATLAAAGRVEGPGVAAVDALFATAESPRVASQF